MQLGQVQGRVGDPVFEALHQLRLADHRQRGELDLPFGLWQHGWQQFAVQARSFTRGTHQGTQPAGLTAADALGAEALHCLQVEAHRGQTQRVEDR